MNPYIWPLPHPKSAKRNNRPPKISRRRLTTSNFERGDGCPNPLRYFLAISRENADQLSLRTLIPVVDHGPLTRTPQPPETARASLARRPTIAPRYHRARDAGAGGVGGKNRRSGVAQIVSVVGGGGAGAHGIIKRERHSKPSSL